MMLKEILCLYGLYQAKQPCTCSCLLLSPPPLKKQFKGSQLSVPSGFKHNKGMKRSRVSIFCRLRMRRTSQVPNPRSEQFRGSWKT